MIISVSLHPNELPCDGPFSTNAALRCPGCTYGSPIGNPEAQLPSPYEREQIARGGFFKSPDIRAEGTLDFFNDTDAEVPTTTKKTLENTGTRTPEEILPVRRAGGDNTHRPATL
ncbi:hypothetical protein NDU88_008842 [Pleurodeles waltl]|uniref:Uncharacterized protein n=1 Tax=Pleurodeles waltl TaxID=8319 RepID=A0AAV7QVU1_PLEWA|nr:hypothetical protein NDU88_008842 [Pleurodeles waltl]